MFNLGDLASGDGAFLEANEVWKPSKGINKIVFDRRFLKGLFFEDVLNKTITFACLGGLQGGRFRMLEQ